MAGAGKKKAKKGGAFGKAGKTADAPEGAVAEASRAGEADPGASQPSGPSTGPSQAGAANTGPRQPRGPDPWLNQPASASVARGSGSGSGIVGAAEVENPMGPDPRVTKAENDAVAGKLDLKSLTINDSVSFPRRPSYGTQGKEVVVKTNYFQITPGGNLLFYRYEINSISPDEKQSRRRKRIIELLLAHDVFQKVGLNNIATDWKSIIITTKKLDLGAENRLSTHVRYYEKGLPGPRPLNQGEQARPKEWPRVDISSSMKNMPLSVDDLMNYLGSSHQSSCENKDQIVQALNIVMSRFPSCSPDVAAYGNRYFSQSQNVHELGGGLIALCGYFTSVRPSISRLLLNVNTVAAAFYQEQWLVDLVYYYRTFLGCQNNDARIQRFVKGLRVKLTYLGQSPGSKTATVCGLAKRPNSNELGATSREVRFTWQEKPGGPAKTVTVEEYFKKRYKVSLRWPNEPVINIGNAENPRLVPGELCWVLPGQLSRTKLDASQTEKMIRFAVREPQRTAALICDEGRNVLGTDKADGPMNFNLRVARDMIAVQARLLPPPHLQFGTGGATIKAAMGSWALLDRTTGHAKFLAPVNLATNTWTYIQLNRGGFDRLNRPRNPSARGASLEAVIAALEREMRLCGTSIGSPYKLEKHMVDLPGFGYESLMNRIFQELKARKVKLVFIVLPDKSGPTNTLYEFIKRAADTVYGIHCVCALAERIVKCDAQLMGNLALKVTMKLGGTTHRLLNGQLGDLEQNRTMIVGIDVTHPSPGSRTTAPSIASCVASVDGKCAKWLGSVRIQMGTQEMVHELKAMMIERLRQWEAERKNNPFLEKGLPTKIIVYRDGVSEGQYQQVLDHEATQIDQAISELYEPGKPKAKVSILIVGKRHHTRFFATGDTPTNKKGNVMNGLVVDRGITNERLWDFYLQAHDGLQGTAKPAHYVVIKDQNNLGVEALEKLTHNLCYLWCRATKSVSICPPAYYADILCTRARCWMADQYDDTTSSTGPGTGVVTLPQPHVDIASSMFFI